MNFITLILSLLLILSFGASAILEKRTSQKKLQSTFLAHAKANRKAMSKCDKTTYSQLLGVIKDPTPKKVVEKTKLKTVSAPSLNPSCAQLNIYPLIMEGREAQPLLYETTAELIRLFYKDTLFKSPRFEYTFLDLFLKKAKLHFQKNNHLILEKISLQDPSFQSIYYKMLKGTKQHDLQKKRGYPSLLDSIKVDPRDSKICLSHAHPDQLCVFFGHQAAQKIFQELHKEKAPPVTAELLENICAESGIILKKEIFDWFKMGREGHLIPGKTTFVAKDPDNIVSLRKKIYLNF